MSISRASRYPSRSNTLRAAATKAARVRRPRSVTGGSRSSDDRAIDGGGSAWSSWPAWPSPAATLTMCTVIRHRLPRRSRQRRGRGLTSAGLKSIPIVLQCFWSCSGDDIEVVAQQCLEVFPRSAITERYLLLHGRCQEIVERAEERWLVVQIATSPG